jgi:prepilin-type N-terminal cleavage/methylation domain-containing protein
MEKRKRVKRRIKGITLIELLVVVAIITILAAILLPYIGNRVEDARISAMEEMISSLRSATTLMFNDMSVYPTQWINFVSPFGTGWRGPYLQRSDTASSTPETWESGSPWGSGTDLRLITLNASATSVRFASSTNLFPLRYGICLVVSNPLNSGAPTIPYSSLQKIDTDLDDGAHNSGYIVHSSTDPAAPPGVNPPFAAAPTMTFVSYSATPVNSYFYILINAIP